VKNAKREKREKHKNAKNCVFWRRAQKTHFFVKSKNKKPFFATIPVFENFFPIFWHFRASARDFCQLLNTNPHAAKVSTTTKSFISNTLTPKTLVVETE